MKLVCTDLDRTLLPNGEQSESPHARPILWHLLSTYSVALAYVSGRDLPRVLDAISEYNLPTPDVIVADVGTSVYTRDGDNWALSADWQGIIAKDWNGLDSAGVEAILSGIDDLQTQENSRQSLLKRSYYFAQDVDEALLRKAVENALEGRGIKASVVMSDDPEKCIGLLDVLPRSATKREAVSYLQNLFGLPPDQVMFAGDSGNDVLALCAEQPGVLVANADAVTVDAVQRHLDEARGASSAYFAKGNLEVAGFDVLNGYYSAGIIEGLMHYRPQWLARLQDVKWLQEAIFAANVDENLQSRHSA